MRKRFEQQLQVDIEPISEVEISTRSRHELPALLAGLQYLFVTPELNEAVFSVLEEKIMKGKKQTGRLGMSLWEILVMGCVRLNLDTNYDALEDLVNNHQSLRGILGVNPATQRAFRKPKRYGLQTIKDNVSLLDQPTLDQINELVVRAGHALKKKEEAAEKIALHLKSDSYVVESTIHFPTDLNLLWDSARKSLDTIKWIRKYTALPGWGKIKYWYRLMRNAYRKASEIHRKKGANFQNRLKRATLVYLNNATRLYVKLKASIVLLKVKAERDAILAGMLEPMDYYFEMLEKHIDLVDRRIIKGQRIPHEEKLFSIFEPHTEWLSKGKAGKAVELGHKVLITTDQYHFILDYEVVIKQVDKALALPLGKRLDQRYGQGYRLASVSFDRGFYTQLVKKTLEGIFGQVIMPKPGKKTEQQKAEEESKLFVGLRKAHAGVESNINELEHSGANRVPDKGLEGFKRYVGLSVLAYNIKRLGKMVIEKGLLAKEQPPKKRLVEKRA